MDDQERDRAVWKGEALSATARNTILAVAVFALIGAVLFRLAI